MTFQGDPYRTLGVLPGASLNEIRSAYRRLAKQYHPDAAGERALPRFLAIQAAYERLVDGEGRLRSPGSRDRGSGTGSRPADPADRPTGEPWRADPDRARASRDAWRARRSGTGDGSGRGGPAAAGGRGDGGRARPGGTEWARAGGGSGRRRAPGAGEPPGERGRADRPGRRGPRRATRGSTTYDEASDSPRDPAWEGGDWYGPSSGTYWTINPREYADPRKHGPEYLARARRSASREAGPGERPRDEPGRNADVAGTEATGPRGEWRWTGTHRTTTDGGETDWSARAWAYEAADAAGDAWGARGGLHAGTPGADATTPPPADAASLPDLEALALRASPRSLLALARRPDPRWRLLLALIGWPPIGFAVGSLLSTVSGCASFSASCPEPLPLLSIAIQPLVVAGLFLAGPAAAIAAFAALAALAAALPIAAVLSVGTVPESRVGAQVLGVLVAIAYLVALIAGTRAIWRSGPGSHPPAP